MFKSLEQTHNPLILLYFIAFYVVVVVVVLNLFLAGTKVL